MLFKNKVVHAGDLKTYTAAQIEAEPMYFKADAKLFGARIALDPTMPITCDFIRVVERHWGSLNGVLFDSRAHMLMPGVYPCIPGWHTDEAPRPTCLNGQPDLTCGDYEAQHMLAVVDAGTDSLTKFAVTPVNLDVDRIERGAGSGT